MSKATLFDGSKWDKQFYTTQDALAERPPIEYVIKKVLPVASLSVFYGLPSSYKSNLMIDAVSCVTLGLTWLKSEDFQGFEVPVRRNVLWVDSDSGEDVLHERFGASLNAHGKTLAHRQSAGLHYASFLDPPFMATDDAAVNELILRARTLKVGMIVLDNLGTVSGGADENSPEMIPVMNRLRLIAKRTRAAVIVIHHITKYGTKSGDRKTPRGHGSIEAAVDNAFAIERDDEGVTITQTKARRGRILLPFGAVFEYEQKPKLDDLRVMRFVGIPPQLPIEYVKARATLLDYFKGNREGNQRMLVTLLMKNRIGNNKARSIVHTLARSNFLVVKPAQAHNQTIYRLGDVNAELQL